MTSLPRTLTPASRPLRWDWLSWLLLAVLVAASVAVWQRVPLSLPVHWNWAGEPDSYASRDLALTMMPLAASGSMLLCWLLTRGMPVRQSGLVTRAVRRVLHGMLGLFVLMHAALIVSALGGTVSVPRVALDGAALLVILLGVVMRTVPQNGVIGVRIPATLSSTAVWQRTHRLCSTLMILAGCLTLAASLLSVSLQTAVLVGGLLLTAVVSVLFAIRLRRLLDPSNTPPPVDLQPVDSDATDEPDSEAVDPEAVDPDAVDPDDDLFTGDATGRAA